MVGTYPVITLCGSTRFKDAFIEAQKRLTLAGNIVISVGLFGHSGDDEVWEGMDEGTITATKAMTMESATSSNNFDHLFITTTPIPSELPHRAYSFLQKFCFYLQFSETRGNTVRQIPLKTWH